MAATKQWTVEIYIAEHDDDTTRAEARLRTGSGSQLNAVGTARRNPRDIGVPEIGDELAAARALAELAHRLLHAAADDIEGMTHEDVHLEH